MNVYIIIRQTKSVGRQIDGVYLDLEKARAAMLRDSDLECDTAFYSIEIHEVK